MYFGSGREKLIKEIKVESSIPLRGRGDGIMFGEGMRGGRKPKWVSTMIEFFQGKKKLKPSNVAKGLSKVFKISSSIANKTESFKNYSGMLNNASNLLNKAGNFAEQRGRGGMYFGDGYKKATYMSGSGKGSRHNIKRMKEHFIKFLRGETKIKPKQLLIAGGVLVGIASAGAALIPGGQGAAVALGTASSGMFSIANKGVKKAAMDKISQVANKMESDDKEDIEGSGLVAGTSTRGYGLVPGGRYLEGRGYKSRSAPFLSGSGLKPGGALFPIAKMKKKCKSNLLKQTLPGKNIFGNPIKKYTRRQAKGHCNQAVKQATSHVENYDPNRKIKYEIKPSGTVSGSGRGRQSRSAPSLLSHSSPYSRSGKKSKEDVYYGRAKRTSGGLTKKDLMKNSKGKIVSKKMYKRGKLLSQRRGKGLMP